MSTGLIDIMKRASLDAVERNKPCDVRYGTVTSISPLKVRISQDLILPSEVLVVPQHLTDYEVPVSMKWVTSANGSHEHDYSGTSGTTNSHTHSYGGTTQSNGEHTHAIVSNRSNTITIHNALKVNDRIALLRQAGGQSYLILDRI